MQNLVPDLLPRLEEHRLSDLDAGPDAFYPYYEGYSLVNLPDSVCHWLGAPTFGAGPLAPEILNQWQAGFRHVILMVIDGFGFNTLQSVLEGASQNSRNAIWSDLARDAVLAPVTSIVPSTTAAALTTFWTGRTPAEHGIVGYEVWLKEFSLIANMIMHSPASYHGDAGSLRKAGFSPETFLPVPTIGPHLLKHGVKPYAFQHQAIAHSGLSTMLFPGVEVTPFRTLGDMWVGMNSLLNTHPDERNYLYIYWGDLDELSHRFGPHDQRVALELEVFSQQLSYFIHERRQQARQDTLVIVTADHGHIHTPHLPEFEVRNHPELLDCLTMLPSGEARLPFVYLRPGREQKFLDYVERTWPGLFQVIPSQQAIQAGLFGSRNIYQRLSDRVGDFVLVPQKDAYWWFADRDNPLLGRHGGLSRTEMLSPFFSFVLLNKESRPVVLIQAALFILTGLIR